MAKYTIRRICCLSSIAALLIAVGWFAHGWHDGCNVKKDRRARQGGYRFISPLLDVELPEGYDVRQEPIPFRKKLEALVSQKIQSSDVRDMSVYYRDLSDGPWFGINENKEYNAASMMKLPVLIGWLKRGEKDPNVLKRKLTFDEKSYHGPPQVVKPDQTLKSGHSYTVEELLWYMMNFSDNRAMSLLFDGLTYQEYSSLFPNMDVTYDPVTGNNRISAHGYSGFLRILYNASFLNKEMSEYALKLMSTDDFPLGIKAGIPKDVLLSSKYGVVFDEKRSDEALLHEFGIVYHPKGPYILGVMTEGNNLDRQAGVIRAVSELVYSAVEESVQR